MARKRTDSSKKWREVDVIMPKRESGSTPWNCCGGRIYYDRKDGKRREEAADRDAVFPKKGIGKCQRQGGSTGSILKEHGEENSSGERNALAEDHLVGKSIQGGGSSKGNS